MSDKILDMSGQNQLLFEIFFGNNQSYRAFLVQLKFPQSIVKKPDFQAVSQHFKMKHMSHFAGGVVLLIGSPQHILAPHLCR